MNFDALKSRLMGHKFKRKMPSPDKKTNDMLKERKKKWRKLDHRIV